MSKRPLETYSKRHARRLQKARNESSSDSEESNFGYSAFKKPLKRMCPSSAALTTPDSVSDSSFSCDTAADSILSDAPLPSFSSNDEVSEAEQLFSNRNPSEQMIIAENDINVSTSSGTFKVLSNAPPKETLSDSSVINTSSGQFNISTFDSCQDDSSGISFLDLSGLLPVHSPSQIDCRNPELPSNSDGFTFTVCDETLRTFRKELRIYCVENKLSHVAINNLLSLLNSLPPFSLLPEDKALPKDARTLLETVRHVNVTTIADGETYIHIGLAELLRLYYVIVRPVDIFNILVGIDGVPISDSSHGHFVPIMCAVLPDDPDEQSYVSAIGIWYGDKTKISDPNKFMEPFVKEAKPILREGVSIDGKKIPVKLFGLTFDAVGKSEMLGCISHSGYWACPRCKIKGVSAGGVHFPGIEDHPPRSHDEFHPDYLKLKESNLIEDNYRQRYTILEQLPGVDLVNDVVLDYMHILCIGVAKYYLKLLTTGKAAFRLSPDDVERVNKRHLKLKKSLPREFARTMKTISKHYKWKAVQGRQFICYTGIVTLYKILPEKQYENFLLLHAASYILLHPTLCRRKKYLSKARNFYNQFIVSFTNIFGENHTTYNIHMLKHLPDDVERFINLNRCSAFQFENFLGILIRLLRKGDLPAQQAVKRLLEKAHAALAKKGLEKNKGFEEVLFTQEHKAGPTTEGMSNQFRLATFRKKSGSRKFTLRATINIKDNCCILDNNEVVLVQNFTLSISGGKYVLFNTFLNKRDFYVQPIKSSKLGIYEVDTLSPEIKSAPITSIKNKMALVKSKGGSYVAIPLLHSA